MLASAGHDGTVRVWDPLTGQPIAALRIDGELNSLFWEDEIAAGGTRGIYVFNLVRATAAAADRFAEFAAIGQAWLPRPEDAPAASSILRRFG
jgi:hypothetical protein